MLALVALGIVGIVGLVVVVIMAVVSQFSEVTFWFDHPYGRFHFALRKECTPHHQPVQSPG